MKRIGYLGFILVHFMCSANQFFDLLGSKQPSIKSNKKSSCAITYKLESWRRLGDNIATVCKALLLAQNYGLPLLYKPFPYSDQFTLHKSGTILTTEIENQYAKVVAVDKMQDIEDALKTGESILFESHFLTETPWLYAYSRQNLDFEKKIKDMFTPLITIDQLPKPASVVTVALHVRKGGGFDMPLASQQEYTLHEEIKGIYLKKNNPANSCTDIWPLKWPTGYKYIEAVKKFMARKTQCSDYVWPIKFPPDQYYIDQLKYLAEFLKEKNLLVFLFTDDQNPEKIVKRYSKALEEYPRIIFSYREADNHHTKNVLQDLFSIVQCDCLISASSSFAHAAQLLGNHSIIMMPTHATTLPDKIVMDRVAVFGANQAYDFQKRALHFSEIEYPIQ